MTISARDALIQVFSGDRPGVTFYSLQPRDSWKGGDFPVALFQNIFRQTGHDMNGHNWDIRIWDVTFVSLPTNEAWRRSADSIYDWIFSQGGKIAWIGDGVGYSPPPMLFVPQEMAQSVLEARKKDGTRFGMLNLDLPVSPLDDSQLTQLRIASAGLSDVD